MGEKLEQSMIVTAVIEVCASILSCFTQAPTATSHQPRVKRETGNHKNTHGKPKKLII